jgi:hypothetical protein
MRHQDHRSKRGASYLYKSGICGLSNATIMWVFLNSELCVQAYRQNEDRTSIIVVGN